MRLRAPGRERGEEEPDIREAHGAVAVEVGRGIHRGERGEEEPDIREARHSVAVEVGGTAAGVRTEEADREVRPRGELDTRGQRIRVVTAEAAEEQVERQRVRGRVEGEDILGRTRRRARRFQGGDLPAEGI